MKSAQERYRQSYFDEFPDVWYHGDHVLITESREGNGGGVIMLGRSDGVLYVRHHPDARGQSCKARGILNVKLCSP